MQCYNHPSSFNNVGPIAPGIFKHCSQFRLREVTVEHTLKQVRAQFKFPIPPFWPTTTYHASPSINEYDFTLLGGFRKAYFIFVTAKQRRLRTGISYSDISDITPQDVKELTSWIDAEVK